MRYSINGKMQSLTTIKGIYTMGMINKDMNINGLIKALKNDYTMYGASNTLAMGYYEYIYTSILELQFQINNMGKLAYTTHVLKKYPTMKYASNKYISQLYFNHLNKHNELYSSMINMLSKEIAIKALKMIYNKSGEDFIYQLLMGIYGSGKYGSMDGEDIISIATMGILESIKNMVSSDIAIKNIFKGISQYIYNHKKSNKYVHTFVRDYNNNGDEIIEDTTMLSKLHTTMGIDTIEDSMQFDSLIDSMKLSIMGKKIVMLLCNGYNQSQVASKLNIAQGTVSKHMDKIKKSLPLQVIAMLKQA